MKKANTGEPVGGTASLQFTTTAGTDLQGPTKATKGLTKDSRHASHYIDIFVNCNWVATRWQ